MDNITRSVQKYRDEVIQLRRDFHCHPELGLQEYRTGQIVVEYLKSCGFEIQRFNKTGVAGLLRGNREGPTLLMRADMDGLPIQEESDAEYKSKIDGVMHACGHDAHTAMLLVAAKILCGYRKELSGNIKFVFEPNEENIGALAMIEEGVLENPKVDACVGVHVWSPLESGKIGVKAGPVMAGMQHFRLVIKGIGGHTATPQSAIDPIFVSSAIIQAVQSIQTRETDVLNEPTVIMFGAISGGSAANVIPDEVTLDGTIRYLFDGNDQSNENPLARFRRIVKGVCDTHRADFELEFPFGHPTLINDRRITEMFVSEVLAEIKPTPAVEPYITLAGEDFSEFASRVPGLFYFLGAGKPGEINYPHHHPRFDIDENVLEKGVEIHVRTALCYLKKSLTYNLNL